MVHIIRSSKPRIVDFQPTAFLIDTVDKLSMFLVEPIQRMFNFNNGLKMTVLHNNLMLLDRVMELIL